jgi:hypothetical protein
LDPAGWEPLSIVFARWGRGVVQKETLIIPSGIAALAGPRPVWRGRTIKFYLLNNIMTVSGSKGFNTHYTDLLIVVNTPISETTLQIYHVAT